MENRFLIGVEDDESNMVFIDEVVLEGNKSDLVEKLSDMNYVQDLGIHESFWFNKFTLIPEDSIEFPDHA